MGKEKSSDEQHFFDPLARFRGEDGSIPMPVQRRQTNRVVLRIQEERRDQGRGEMEKRAQALELLGTPGALQEAAQLRKFLQRKK